MTNLTRRNFLKVAGMGTVSAALLAACGSSSTSSTDSTTSSVETSTEASSGGATANDTSTVAGGKTKITVGMNATAESIGPYITNTSAIKMIYNMLYMQLGNVVDGTLTSNLYSSFEESGDMHYVVQLYEDISDNAGNPITAEDVAFSYNTAKAAGTSQTYTYFDNAEATDTYTFEFDMLTDAVGSLNQVMSTVNIISQAAYEASSDEMGVDPVSCGAYVVREFTPGANLVIEKSDNFWCEDMFILSRDKQANVDVIEIKFFSESTQLEIALQQGTVDAAIEINATTAEEYEGSDGWTVTLASSNFFYNMYFDVREGHVFENQALRQAVCYAVDQYSVMYGATQGTGQVNKAVATHYSADYNPEWDEADYYDTDIEKAKELLAEAGYAEGELTIQLMCQWEATKPAAEVVQACLEEIGIHSEISAPDTALFGTYQDCTSDVWDINIMFYAASNIGAASLNAQFNTAVRDNGMTFSGIQDDELQALVEAAISEKTYSAETYDEVQAYLKEKAYVYGLYSPMNGYVYNSGITEIYIDANGRFLPNACIYSDSYDVYEE